MKRSRSPAWLTIAASLLPFAAACGGGAIAQSPPAQAPVTAPVAVVSPTPSEPQPASPPAPAAPSSIPVPVVDAASAYVPPADPTTVQELFDDTTNAPPAVLKAKAAAGDPAAAMSQTLTELAKTAAPGMGPDGPLAVGSLKEKQSLQEDITFLPGKCYAILGYSRQVKDVDLYLLLPPGILSAQDGTTSGTPVIGGPDRPMCPIATVPVTYKLRIVADHGAGEVAVQLYSKSR